MGALREYVTTTKNTYPAKTEPENKNTEVYLSIASIHELAPRITIREKAHTETYDWRSATAGGAVVGSALALDAFSVPPFLPQFL